LVDESVTLPVIVLCAKMKLAQSKKVDKIERRRKINFILISVSFLFEPIYKKTIIRQKRLKKISLKDKKIS
jgi:hypothetical protein